MTKRVMLGVMAAAWALTARGQWQTQTFDLQPGWNAIYLRVQPVENACAQVFTNVPVLQCSWWYKDGTGFDFDLDPDIIFPRTADWKYWYATNVVVSTFGSLLAGESYQVFVDTNAAPFSLSVKGRVVINPAVWVPGVDNLAGLQVPDGGSATFGEYFTFASEFTVNASTGTVFRVLPSGATQRIFQPFTTGVPYNEAFWITAGGEASSYPGPIRVTTDSGRRLLDFGATLTPRTLRIENHTEAARSVTLRYLYSESAPEGEAEVQGRVPLLMKPAGELGADYEVLPDVLVTNVPARGALELRLAPDAVAMADSAADSIWAGVLSVTDAGNEYFEHAVVDARVGVSCSGAIGGMAVPTGLWVGDVTVNAVSRAAPQPDAPPVWDVTEPLPVSRPFRYRVIFHVDAAGETRLLPRVLVAWLPAASGLTTNGVYTLFADEADAAAYQAAHPEADITRISSIAFPAMDPVTASGMFGGESELVCDVTLAYDDPLNPFVHRYHPQHDNLEYRNDEPVPLPEGVESYTVDRTLRFQFSGDRPAEASAETWGVSTLGGAFREQVNGLNKVIYASGTFVIERICDVERLQ